MHSLLAMPAIAMHNFFEWPWNIVHIRLQLGVSKPDGPAPPWECRATVRTTRPSILSKITTCGGDWVNLSTRASSCTTPAGGCFSLSTSRTVEPSNNTSSRGSTCPLSGSESRRKADFSLPWRMHLEKVWERWSASLSSCLVTAFDRFFFPNKASWSWSDRPSLRRSMKRPANHKFSLLSWVCALRWGCELESDVGWRRRVDRTIIANIEIYSSAVLSAKAEIKRVDSSVRRFLAAPRGMSNRLGRQCTISCRTSSKHWWASIPVLSAHQKARDEAGLNSGRFGTCVTDALLKLEASWSQPYTWPVPAPAAAASIVGCWARGQRRCLVYCHGVSNGEYRSCCQCQTRRRCTNRRSEEIVALPATESLSVDERTSFRQAVSALALLGWALEDSHPSLLRERVRCGDVVVTLFGKGCDCARRLVEGRSCWEEEWLFNGRCLAGLKHRWRRDG